MPIFLLVFFSIYGAGHVYAWRKGVRAFSPGRSHGCAFAGFSLAMIVAPVLVRVLERAEFEGPARMLAWFGYSWMGLIFFFVCTALFLDCMALGAWMLGRLCRLRLEIPARVVFFPALAVAFIGAGYGYYEANTCRIERHVIASPKISRTTGSIRIVQISDLHLGFLVGKTRLGEILAAVKSLSPDLLVATGDIVDGQIDGLAGLAPMFREITPQYGKYAVTGNHEFYAGLASAREFIERAGFTLLRNSAREVGGVMRLVGVDDVAGRRFGVTPAGNEEELLAAGPADLFTILLKHRPSLPATSRGRFDLQLSGHTHQGQIFPFLLATWFFFPVQTGLTELPGGGHLYLSRGVGTWGPPMRLLAPPEIAVIELVHGE